MWTLLNYRIWIALALSLALSVSHYKAFKIGGDRVTSAWDAERLAQARDLAKFSEAARSKEAEMQASTRKVTNDYIAQKKRHADAAVRSADSLRDLQAELAQPTQSCSDPAATAGTYGPGELERELLNHCATALAGLATEADRLENKIVGLQGYVQAIGVAK